MIPAGYMAKRVVRKPDWLTTNRVEDIYSVSGCISKDFADYITFWKHNGYWLFDSSDQGLRPASSSHFLLAASCLSRLGRRFLALPYTPSFSGDVLHIGLDANIFY